MTEQMPILNDSPYLNSFNFIRNLSDKSAFVGTGLSLKTASFSGKSG